MEGTRVSYAAPRRKTHERRYGRVEAPNTSEWLDTRRRQKVRNQPNTIENNGKEVGVLLGGSLILQTVIGPGIFTAPKGVIQGCGSIGASFLIWAGCGIMSTLAALCFVELQLSVPRAGCEYGYIHKAFGKVPSFIYTWMRIAVAEPVTTAVFTIAFADYVADYIFDFCGPPESLRKLIAVAATLTLGVINGRFLNLATGFKYLANIGKIVTLGTMIGVGIYRICIGEVKVLSEGFQHSKTSYHPYAFAMYSSLWAYGGWANVPNVTAGVRKPIRNLPRLILTVIPFVTIVYLLMVTSFFTVLTPKEMISAEAIAVEWSKKVMGPVSFIIPLGVCLIALGNANNTFLTAGRLSSVAVHDGYIPEVLSYVNIKTRIHLPAVIVRCIMCTIFIHMADVGMLMRFYVFTVWLFHGLTITGLLILRWKKRNYRLPYQVPIFIPIVVIIFSIGLVTLPFTVLPERPSAEFIFSIALALVSLLGFFPFEKTKGLLFLLDQFTVFVQLILNVVPPKISKHTQSRHISRKRKWTPSNTKLRESFYRPGRFSTSSLDSIVTFSDDDTEEQRRRKISLVTFSDDDTEEQRRRKISSASNYSVDYCNIMNNYDDQINTETDSMLSGYSGRSGSNDCSSTESAESARRLSTESSITYLAPEYKEVDSKL